MALNQLVGEYSEDEFLYITYHHDDDWSTPASEARISWYFGLPGVYTSYPTTFFDGGVDYHQGTGGCYNTYNNYIQEHLQDESPFALEAYGAFDGEDSFVEAYVTLEEDISATDLVVRMVVVESDLTFQEYSEHIAARLFLEEEELTISDAGESINITRNFVAQPNWDEENLSLIVFVQSDNIDENYPIYQATKMIEAGAIFEGVVSSDGVPIPSKVWADGTPFRTYASQEDGSYLLHVAPGQHVVKSDYFGYYEHASTVMSINLQQTIQYDIDLQPRPVNSCSGTITDINDNPISNAIVTLMEVPEESEFQKTAYTDENGEYTFTDVPADRDYTMNFSASGYDEYLSEMFLPIQGGDPQDATLYGYLGFESSECDFVGEADWQWGEPTTNGGPDSAYDGTNVWGTNLEGYYFSNSNRYLVTPEYGIIGTDANDAYLKFYHWYETNDGWDGGNVQISVNGGDWTLIYPEENYPDNSVVALTGSPGYTGEMLEWTPAHFDLTDHIGSSVKFRFRFASTNSEGYRGWFIDHFTIYGADLSENSTHVGDDMITDIPKKINLSQNYPNPFNPQTQISFDLPATQKINLKIYDVSGKLIKTLIDEEKEAGYHSVRWNGTDEVGEAVSSGVYIYKLESDNGFSQARQMLLLK